MLHLVTAGAPRLVLAGLLAIIGTSIGRAGAATCDGAQQRVMHADVVALDQPMMINRLGTSRPEAMMYALRGDLAAIDPGKPIGPGNVQLRPGKRPRPLVLRVDVHDCLKIDFWNYLAPTPASPTCTPSPPASARTTRPSATA